MPESRLEVHIEALVDRALSLRREALDRESKARIELFAKVSLRARAMQACRGGCVSLDHVHESGLALRVVSPGRGRAGFAAASGLSRETLRWALEVACSLEAHAPTSGPGPMDAIPSERWDLDPETDLPIEEALAGGLATHPEFEWVEAGTTLEVLIGADGWLAGRRRHRIWALEGGASPRLVAQRGFGGLNLLFDPERRKSPGNACRGSGDLGVLAMTPEAASSVVSALVDHFHGVGIDHSRESGPGWTVSDEPDRADALSGGSFDDVGFPSTTRVLAEEGLWRGEIGGPGSLWRASFRQPPMERTSNLVVPPGRTAEPPEGVAIARRCRVLRMSGEVWVLELDLENDQSSENPGRLWARVRPQVLLDACVSRLGGSVVTAAGPIVPGLLFDGLAAAARK